MVRPRLKSETYSASKRSISVALAMIGLFSYAISIVVASVIYGFAIGNVTTLSPIVVCREFGPVALAAVFGTAATVIQLSTSLGPALIGHLRQYFGNYSMAYLVAAVITAVGCTFPLVGGRGMARASSPS